MSNQILGNVVDFVVGVLPLDLQTARTGDLVNLRNASVCGILIIKGVGTDNDDPTFTLRQAVGVGGTPKDLAVITEYWEKEAVTDLTGTGVWTRVTQTAAATIIPGDPSAQSAALYYTEVAADQLDVDGGYDSIQMNSADTGTNAQLGTILYILGGLRHKAAPQTLPNAII